jgi:hypothetical protein
MLRAYELCGIEFYEIDYNLILEITGCREEHSFTTRDREGSLPNH